VNKTLIQVDNLVKEFEITKGLSRRRVGVLRAVNNISFSIQRGEILGLVGESGCGKTTAGRCIMRAIPATAGHVRVNFGENGDSTDLLELDRRELKAARKNMRLIFQDPYSSLNARMSVRDIVSEVLVTNNITTDRREIDDRVASILGKVGLSEDQMSLYPHAFSGGQRQRIAIARALVSDPKFVVADEPVSALDVSIQAQILNLLLQLKEDMDLTFLFIAHNLSVVAHTCDRIAVMYLGEIAELAESRELNENPKHPYTEALLSAVPEPDPRVKKKRVTLRGEVGDFMNLPTGCLFSPRCPYAQDICSQERPPLVNVAKEGEPEHWAACHFSDTLTLQGSR
jgi:peptide/nickel transport system ATP-binding protein